MSAARRFRFALSCGAAVLLLGCAAQIPGRPIPAAGFTDPPQETPGPAAPGAATPVQIPRPLRAAGDPCALLDPHDLEPVGGLHGSPHPGNPFPDTCTFPLGTPGDGEGRGGAARNTAAAGFHRPYAEAAREQPDGVATSVRGYSSWLYCEVVQGFQTCTATTAVTEERSLVTMLSLRDAAAADTTARLHGLTEAALQRLRPR
ncbi:DUF3558 domain-containing protein [Bounagaea algeriensis]